MVDSVERDGPAVRAFWAALDRREFPRMDLLLLQYPAEERALIRAYLKADVEVAEGRLARPTVLADGPVGDDAGVQATATEERESRESTSPVGGAHRATSTHGATNGPLVEQSGPFSATPDLERSSRARSLLARAANVLRLPDVGGTPSILPAHLSDRRRYDEESDGRRAQLMLDGMEEYGYRNECRITGRYDHLAHQLVVSLSLGLIDTASAHTVLRAALIGPTDLVDERDVVRGRVKFVVRNISSEMLPQIRLVLPVTHGKDDEAAQ